MEVPDWFLRWIGQHRLAFLLPDGWIDSAVTWWPTFAALSATADELTSVTADLQASDSPPRFPGDHLPAVKAAVGRVRDRKAEAARKAAAGSSGDRGVCTECGDTGWVIVPHPKHVSHAGEWLPAQHNRGEPVLITCGATCRCYRGRKAFDWLAGRDKEPLSLDRYERINSRWRDQIAERDRAAAELFEAMRTVETWKPSQAVRQLAAQFASGRA